MKTHAPRVPPVQPGARPQLRVIEERILQQRGQISVLYQVLLNSAPIAQGWEALLTAVRNQTSIPADLRELIILRVAVSNRASFEFQAHVPHALRAGVPQAMIDAVRQTPLAAGFTESERWVLSMTDHMTRSVDVPAEVMAEITSRYGATEVVELVATVAAYNMVSRFLVALDVVH